MDHSPETAPAAPTDPHAARDAAAHVKGYILIGLAQCACIVVTVALSYVNFGSTKASIIAVMISAAFNAAIIAGISMHLRSERWTIYRFLIFTVIFLLAMFFLPLLAFHDHIYIH